jgi:gliding motility-associated-like protein
MTTQIAAPLPFSQNFETAPAGFTLNNGAQPNKWVVGSATGNTGNSLYISNDNGLNNAYTITGNTVVQAYRDIQMPASVDQLSLSFDWKGQGEVNDYFRVWVVPASFVPSPGTAITTANGTPIGNTFTMNNTWQTYNDIIYASAYSGNVMRLVFEWRNNTFTGTQPPAAIDNINVAVIPCPQPTNLALGTYSATQATFNWTGPTSVSPTFDYYVSSTNTAPTSSTNPIGNVATPTVTFNTTPNNTYYVWVRSNCGSGSTSGWVGPASITAPQQPAGMDYSQDFEGTHGWAYTNGTETNQWTVGTATSNGGTKSLYITNDNGASNAYTLTAATTVHAYRDIQMPASLDQLGITFDWKAQGEANNDYFRVWLVPSTYVPVTGTQIPAGTGIPIGGNFSGNGNWNTFNYTITGANAIQGQMRRLVFEWRNSASGGTQPPAAIDNINFKVITCPTPTNLALATISQDAATFTWTAPASVTPSYDYYYSTSTTAPTATTTPNGNVPGPTVTVEDLPTSTNYNIWVRSNCGGGDTSFWIGPVNFNTPQIPADMPFIENFEGPIEWAINNGNNTNKWVVGTATSDSPTHSLYVSNDNGVTNSYSASLSGVEYVQAYRDVMIPAGTINANLSFRWKCAGESIYDYIRVFLVPITYNPAVNTEITPANSGGIQIGTGNLNLAGSAWNTFNATFNASNYDGQPMRLVFVWRNDFTVQNQPAGAVDSINFSVITCNQPTALTATANATSAVLNWTPVGTESAWDLYVVPATGATAPTATTTPTVEGVTQHPYTYSPLASSTSYVYYVRAVCSDTDKSFWSGPFTFTSAVANDQCDDAVVLTVNPTEDCATVSAGAFTGTTPSTQPNACTGIVGGTDVWYEFTALETAHGISLSDFGGVASTLAQQPLVLSLYEGDQCGDLTPLFCSTNNVISAINLVPGVTYKVRVSINAATPILTRTFNICVNTPDAPSPTDPAACVIRTINPSFSQPNIPYVAPGYPPLLNHNLVQGWRTTAPDQLIEFWPVPNFESVPAATATSGQFIEINANVPAGIYQDFDNTPAGTVFTCTFWHRKRNVSAAYPNPDVCRILAGDPDQPLSTYTQIYLSSTQAVWTQKPEVGEPTITYIVPTGQTRTRFVFEAVSTSSGSPSTGNFIDEVEFRSNNGIITANPTTVDCTENVVNIEAAGFGQWIAHGDNPSTTEIADDHANTTTISGFSTTGVYKYDWTTQFCTSTLEINYDGANLAAPVVTPDVSYCAGETPAQLTAAVEAGNTLKWYDVATDGTALADAPTPSTAVPGVTTYYVSQSLGFCEGPRSAITVTVNAIPAAPQADSVTYCDEAVAAPLTAVADAGNTLVWYDVATGGTPLAGTPTPVTDIDNSYTQPVITIYYVSQLTAAGCEGPRTVVSATVNPSIVPVTAFTLPETICTSADNFSTVPGPGFTTGGYYTSSDATGLVIDSATGIIDMVNSLPGDYTVTYTVDPNLASNVCNAGGSTTVPVTIAPLATPVTTFAYTDVCGNAENQLPQLDPAFTAGGTFGSDAGLSINAQTGEINVAASTPATYTVTYTFNEDPTTCTAAGTGIATIVITPTITPVAAFNYEDAYCFGTSNATPVLDPAFVTGGTFTADNGLAINPATGEVTIAGAAGGIYTITYTLAPDPATCNLGASFKDTFTINGDFNFTLDGECDGYVYYVTATPTDNSYDPSLVTYIWKTAQGQTVGVDSNILNVTEYVNGTTETEVFPMDFVLTVINNGCEKSVTYNVEDISCSIQKGISPNNDGKNDSFELTSLGVKKLTIFNRYGKEVYSKNDYKNEWFGQQNNGNELPTGTYFYVIERTGENKTGWIYINRED